MRKWMLAALAITAPIFGTLYAQLAVGLHLNRSNYLLHEPVYAQVVIRNDTGRPLVFGKDPALRGYLNFEVVDPSGKTLSISDADNNLMEGTVLQAGEIKKMIIPLQDYIKLQKVGDYRIHAWISHRLVKEAYMSKNVTFDVKPGYTLWTKKIGLPIMNAGQEGGAQNSNVIEERTYEIVMLQTENDRLLYLKIEDEDQLYTLRPLGKALGEEKIRCDVDRFGRLHMLLPISPKVYQYLLITPQGTTEEDRVFRTTATIPVLVRDPVTGQISVAGGEEATLGIHFEDSLPITTPEEPIKPEL